MPSTYYFLQSTTLTATSSSVAFTSIPSTYDHLIVRLSLRGTLTGTFDSASVAVNGDTGNSYIKTEFSTNNNVVGSGSDTGRAIAIMNFTSTNTNLFAPTEITIPCYSRTDVQKMLLIDYAGENNATGASNAYLAKFALRWSSTAAITSLTFTPPGTSNFATNSTFYLYAIKNS